MTICRKIQIPAINVKILRKNCQIPKTEERKNGQYGKPKKIINIGIAGKQIPIPKKYSYHIAVYSDEKIFIS